MVAKDGLDNLPLEERLRRKLDRLRTQNAEIAAYLAQSENPTRKPGSLANLVARSDQLIAGFEDTLAACVREHLQSAVLALRMGNPSTRTVTKIRRVLERVLPICARIRNPRNIRQIVELCASVEAKLEIYSARQP
jgi:hypothetical protein